MTIFSFSEVLPLSDLAQIVAVVFVVAVIAPSAVSMGVVGLDRRDSGSTSAGNRDDRRRCGSLFVLVALGWQPWSTGDHVALVAPILICYDGSDGAPGCSGGRR